MKRLFLKLVPFILLAGGILFIVLSVQNLKCRRVYLKADALITDIQTEWVGDETNHHVYVSYSIDGTDYETELGEYSSGMKTGETVNILYDPAHPENIISASLFAPILMMIIGIVAILGSIVTFLKQYIVR